MSVKDDKSFIFFFHSKFVEREDDIKLNKDLDSI